MNKQQTRELIALQTVQFITSGGTVKKVGHRVSREYKPVELTDKQVRDLPKNIRTLLSNIKWNKR